METNERLKQTAEERGVRLWQVAKRFGVSDAQFSRWLREEFSPERMETALRYVDEIASERAIGSGSGV